DGIRDFHVTGVQTCALPIFGTSNGAVVNILGRMVGAAITFGIARMLGKGAVEMLVGKLTQTRKFERWMHRRGGWAVFATRAIPRSEERRVGKEGRGRTALVR